MNTVPAGPTRLHVHIIISIYKFRQEHLEVKEPQLGYVGLLDTMKTMQLSTKTTMSASLTP